MRGIMDPFPPKIVMILRDPVDRYYSAFRMDYDRSRNDPQKTGPNGSLCVERDVRKGVDKLRRTGFLQAPDFSNATQEWNQNDFGRSSFNTSIPVISRLSRGFYSRQITAYLEHFQLGTSLMVIQYEKFVRNKPQVLNELLHFVGSPPYNWTGEELEADLGPMARFRKRNRGLKYPPLSNETRAYMKCLFRPFNEELAPLLGEEWQGVWE